MDPEGDAPSFEISELDGGYRLVEWVGAVRWDELADDESEALSVPTDDGRFINALILAPWTRLNDALEEVEQHTTDRQDHAASPQAHEPNAQDHEPNARDLEPDARAEAPTHGAETAPHGPVLRHDYRDLFGPPGSRGPIEIEREPAGESSRDEPAANEDDARDASEPGPAPYGEEIGQRKKYRISYKFFAGADKEKTARARIRGARKFYVAAFAWWQKQVGASCGFDIALEDLGDDVKKLTHVQVKHNGKAKRYGYRAYSDDPKWAGQPRRYWLVGARKRNQLLRSPSPATRFHLAVFKPDGIRWTRKKKMARSEHVLPKPGIAIVRRPVQSRRKTAVHEVGHLLGLRHPDGKVMRYAEGAARKGGSQYGALSFDKAWCGKIEASIRGGRGA